MKITCPSCKKGLIECKLCHGKGEIFSLLGKSKCGPCLGKGLIKCPNCNGTGKIEA